MQATIPEGTVVGGRWRVLGVLGEGGFGQVLLVEDVSEVGLGQAAIKVLHPNTTPQERQAFLAEVKKIAVLRHQNLVGYLDSGQLSFDGTDLPDHGGEIRPYLVTELCERSLDDHLGTQPEHGIGSSATLSVLGDVVDGLIHLHERDLIHRDIKPGNVLFADGRWKLADFGLMRDLSATGSYHRGDLLIGTPLYMAPELFSTMMATAPSDVYAVGVLAHRCAAGRTVHGGAGPALIHNVTSMPPDIDAGIEPGLAQLIGWCTMAEPTHRPTARQLGDELRRLAAGHGLSPAAPSLPMAPHGGAPATRVVAPPTGAGAVGGPPGPATTGGPVDPAAFAAPGAPVDAAWAPPPSPGAPPPGPPTGDPAGAGIPTGGAPGAPISGTPGPDAAPATVIHGAAPAPAAGGRGRWLLAAGAAAVVLAVVTAVVLANQGGDDDGQVASDEPAGDDAVVETTQTLPDVQISTEGVVIGDDGIVIGGDVTVPGAVTVDAEDHFDDVPCADGGTVGLVQVTNRHDQPVDYVLHIFHFNDAGVRVEESFRTVDNLAPGQAALMGMAPIDESAATCEINSFVAAPTDPVTVAATPGAVVSDCVLDDFLDHWYTVTYTVTNNGDVPMFIDVEFGIVDGAGLRLDEGLSGFHTGVRPGETVQGETSGVFWNLEVTETEPAQCVVTAVELTPDPTAG